MLRVAYHYYRKPAGGDKPSEGPGWRKVFKKQLEHRVPERLFRITSPQPDTPITGDYVNVSLDLRADDWRAEFPDIKIHIDGQETDARLRDGSQPAWRVDVSALKPGAHLVTVRASQREGRSDLRTTTLVRSDDGVDRV